MSGEAGEEVVRDEEGRDEEEHDAADRDGREGGRGAGGEPVQEPDLVQPVGGYIGRMEFWRLGSIFGAIFLAALLAVGLPYLLAVTP